MNQYRGGKGTDRQFFLKAWQCARYKVQRKQSHRRPIRLKQPFVTVIGSIQPELLSDLGDARGREDGFLARLLFSIPDCDPAPDLVFDVDLSDLVARAWEETVTNLRKLRFGEEPVPDGPGVRFVKVPQLVSLSKEALRAFKEWHDGHRAEVHAPDFHRPLRASWSKFKAYCARFALILHCLREVSGDPVNPLEVDAETVRRAVLVTEYFKNHCKHVFSHLREDPREKDISDFIAWLKGRGGRVKFREIYRQHRWGLDGTKSRALKFLKMVEDRHLGHFDTEMGKNKQDVKVFEVIT